MPSSRHPTSILLSPSLKRRLKAQAKRSGHYLSQLIVLWLEQRLAQEERVVPVEETKR